VTEEYFGWSPGIGRNILWSCACNWTAEQRENFGLAYGKKITQTTLDMVKASPGANAIVAAEQLHSGYSVSLDRRPISKTETFVELGASTALYLGLKAGGDYAGELASDAKAGLPSMPPEAPPRIERVVQERVAEIRTQLGRSAKFGETYAVGAVKTPGSVDPRIVVAHASEYGQPGKVTLKPGELLVGRRITGVDAEVKILTCAANCQWRVLSIGATRDVCPNCQMDIFKTTPTPRIVTPVKATRVQWEDLFNKPDPKSVDLTKPD
jgi:hypothetical protein